MGYRIASTLESNMLVVDEVYYVPVHGCFRDDTEIMPDMWYRKRGVHFAIGKYILSVQWGTGNYCVNHMREGKDDFIEESPDAELACWIEETGVWIDLRSNDFRPSEDADVWGNVPSEAFEDIFNRLKGVTIESGVDIDLT